MECCGLDEGFRVYMGRGKGEEGFGFGLMRFVLGMQ